MTNPRISDNLHNFEMAFFSFLVTFSRFSFQKETFFVSRKMGNCRRTQIYHKSVVYSTKNHLKRKINAENYTKIIFHTTISCFTYKLTSTKNLLCVLNQFVSKKPKYENVINQFFSQKNIYLPKNHSNLNKTNYLQPSLCFLLCISYIFPIMQITTLYINIYYFKISTYTVSLLLHFPTTTPYRITKAL